MTVRCRKTTTSAKIQANRNNAEHSTGQRTSCHDLFYEYDVKFCKIFRELKLDDEENGPIPLQVWEGIAQAMADFSGFRISIQAAIFGPPDERGLRQTLEEPEVASGEPTFFAKPGRNIVRAPS